MMLRALPIISLLIVTPALAQTAAGPVLPQEADGSPVAMVRPPSVIDLPTVLRLAQTANPRIGIEEQAIAGTEADRITAGALPNPRASYTGSYQPAELTNFSTRRGQEASVELPLLLGGKRGARVTAANRRIYAARAQAAVTRLDIATDAGTAFVTLLAAQEAVVVRHRAVEELSRLRSVVAGRRSSGVASDYDLVRVDVEVEAARADLADAEVDVISAQADLSNALGVSGWRPEASGRLDGLARLSAGPRRSIDALPSVVAALADERVARADVIAARRERFPEVSLNGGRFWTTSPFGPTYSLGVSLEIPLFDRRNGAVRKAESDARAAEFRTQIAKSRAATEIERYAAQVDTRSAALATFNRQIGAKLPQLGQMAEDAYRLSGGSVNELIDATRSRFENEVTRIDLSRKLAEAMLRLELAHGEGAGDHP
ncbi:MAG: TolC family protein [Candidatus Sphingomonas phytovorans]|nr:TolC family protein [Sphingomonas sp.]WEJ99139.1 MAG: TolC family protein [Sphingomonas sp.]